MKNIDVFDTDKQQELFNAQERKSRQKEISDIKSILNKPEGRRYIWRLLCKCGIFNNSFTGDSNLTAFNEGKRNIGLDILLDVNEAEPAAFARMQNEYISALKSKKEAQDA